MTCSCSIVTLSFLSVVTLAIPRPSEACAPAPPRNVVVQVASESAIIVWDEANQTQHFIRRAAFNATAKDSTPVRDFGFLVPTPTQPQLAEADDKAFGELAKVTAPKTEKQPRPGGGCAMFACGMAAPPGAQAVHVLEEKRVAGYDAKVLKATDAAALAEWLKQHDYESRPALTAWLKPYVEKGWIITAFKIARDPDTPASVAIGSAAVRMSFKTDTPFFPYHEPEDMRDAKGQRLLRVFFLCDKKMTGKLSTEDWPGKVAWAGRLPAQHAETLTALLKIPGYKPSEQTWLTEFEDHSSPRPGNADVTFAPHPEQTPVERPTRIIYASRDPSGQAGFAMFAAAMLSVYLALRLRFTMKATQS